MGLVCPFSVRQVDEKVVRVTALLVVALAIAGMYTDLRWAGIVLAVDFFIRGFTPWPISYIALLGKAIARALRLQGKPINAGPKIFAARLGFVFSAVTAVLAFVGFGGAAIVVILMLAVCAALEGLFGFCVGCHVYSLLLKITGK